MAQRFGVVLRPRPRAAIKSNSPFRFLNLPGELRNQIYGWVFCPTTVDACAYFQSGQHPARGLVLVCRQIHDETIAFLAETGLIIFRPIESNAPHLSMLHLTRKHEQFRKAFPDGLPNAGVKLGINLGSNILNLEGSETDVVEGRPGSFPYVPGPGTRTLYLQLCICSLHTRDTGSSSSGLVESQRQSIVQRLYDGICLLSVKYPKLEKVVVYHCPFRPRMPGRLQTFSGKDDSLMGWLLDHNRASTFSDGGPRPSRQSWAAVSQSETGAASGSCAGNVVQLRQKHETDRKVWSEPTIEFWDSLTVCGRHCTESKNNDFLKALAFFQTIEERRAS